jgi:prolyl-tRNA synthetase
MKNESKIVELLSEMLRKFVVLTETVVKLTGRVDNLTDRVDNLTSRVDNQTVTVDLRLGKVDSEIMKLNVISAENSRALLKMGDYNEGIIRLERAVFKS